MKEASKMKVENKHAKKFSEMPIEMQSLNSFGLGTGIVSSKKDFFTKSGDGGGCCCCCCGTGATDLKR